MGPLPNSAVWATVMTLMLVLVSKTRASYWDLVQELVPLALSGPVSLWFG